jgi:hypothetical protein
MSEARALCPRTSSTQPTGPASGCWPPTCPRVLGHAELEQHSLRWHDNEVWAVHDRDSPACQPEAALVGAAPNARAVIPAADRKFRGVRGGSSGSQGRQFTTEEQEIRVGGRSVAGGVQRPMGSTARLRQRPSTLAEDSCAGQIGQPREAGDDRVVRVLLERRGGGLGELVCAGALRVESGQQRERSAAERLPTSLPNTPAIAGCLYGSSE